MGNLPFFDDVIDIVIPAYNEAESLFHNINQIHDILNENDICHSFILIDDGSQDATWSEIARLKKHIGNVQAIRLSRNFGKEAALCAGISEVTAKKCIIMDSDLQHPPEMIVKMLEKSNEGYDIVECVKINRGDESRFNRIAAKGFYKLIQKLSGYDLDNASDFKLLNEKALLAWKEIGDTQTFFRGIIEWIGYSKAQIPFEVSNRRGGKTKFSTFTLMRLALNALTSFSSKPLYLTNLLSFAFFIGAVILGAQTLYNKLSGKALDGFSTVILIILILGCAILFSLGIIGTYISKIYDEVKGRPRFLVKEKI